MMVHYKQVIVRTDGVCGGQPVIRDTRVPLRTVLASLAEGATIEEIVSDYPTLTSDDIHAVIEFAATAQSGRRGDLCWMNSKLGLKRKSTIAIVSLTLLLLLCMGMLHLYSRRSYRRLLQASCSGDVAKVRTLLGKGAGWRPFNQEEHDMALVRAIECRKYELAQMLLDARTPEGLSMSDLFCFAIAGKDTDSVEFLLNYGLRPHAEEFHPLIVAMSVQSLDIMKLLISRGVDVDSYDSQMKTPLLEAVAREDTAAVRLLLEAGADPNRASKNDGKLYPIIIAVMSGNQPIFQMLLEHGAVLSGVSFPDTDDPVNINRAAELSKNSVMKFYVHDALRRRAEATISEMASEEPAGEAGDRP